MKKQQKPDNRYRGKVLEAMPTQKKPSKPVFIVRSRKNADASQ